ncbi:Transporter aclS [Vanrija pseudolonga]|uniref:Transporter aclS n=1 Tax=Vanrija pseudolonga TaxID=143232 RepID=A0AAF0Y1U8_9TREE|nr:Transporter aclS [Vanrija pseudolonga]
MPSWKEFLQRIEVKQKDDEAEVWQNNRWLNRDNVPLPAHRRLWGFWTYSGLWVLTSMNVSGLSSGASLLGLGLTVGEAMAVVVVGQVLIASLMVATASIGAYWHVSFPMWNRVVWGMIAAYFPLLNRIILSITWNATQGWFGGQCLKVFLGSMFPSIYHMKNTLPASTYMVNADFMCFALFTALCIPLILIPPERIRIPVMAGACMALVASTCLFIWSLARAHGAGPLLTTEGLALLKVPRATGSAKAWAVLYGISAQAGSLCAGILNQSDYSRFAGRPRQPFMAIGIVAPICGILTCFMGIAMASVAAQFYPKQGLIWTIYVLLQTIQENGGPGARAAVFFAGFAFTCSQLGINLTGNLYSGGVDLTSIWPRHLNIRRGAYLTLALSVAMCPWSLLYGSNAFLSVMGGYGVFLGPITGIMVFDYFLVHKRKVKLTNLYECSPSSIYYYYKGVNWRAPVAWACAVGPILPGFIAHVDKSIIVPAGITKLYYLCYPFVFTTAGVVYFALCTIFPVPGVGEVDEYDVFGTFGDAESAPEGTTPVDKEDATVNVVPVNDRATFVV